ncbi:flavonol 3-O-glucosyltransferase UGT89B1-like [Macadamia integrifolia]|uniref:flavonol 3-O-glucosyltransferase UGT89B1-like n=1 Tax=Macadamia integrifolia TaxID=60698 RepID=UPI001C4EAB40|nr:flavonol 3-O-glucosyltransferase UGT89B1-like [Macadamia integrifolia]
MGAEGEEAMSNSFGRSGSAHILVFPYPAQGHMLPLLDLTHQLLIRGLTITILVTPKNLPFLNPLLSQHPPSSIQTLVFPFPSHPSLPPGVENVKDIGNHGNPIIISALSSLTEPITNWFQSHPSPPIAIISDFFLGWTHHLASQLGIPRVSFYSSGAFVSSVLITLSHKMGSLKQPFLSLPNLPNSPSFALDHLPSMLRLFKESDPDWACVKDGFIANSFSWGSVFNTFDALEQIYLRHWQREMGHPRVWAVGPLMNLDSAGPSPTDRGGPSSVPSDAVLTWLGGCPDGSVLFVCFGSQFSPGKPQVEAIAAGLEGSGVRFIWSVKLSDSGPLADECGEILTGLEDRVAGRGLIIRGWAPQVPILNHRAVGGFLTHCGWNSVVEGITAGVLLLAWPLQADQFVNARLLVEDLNAAIRVAEGINAVPDSVEFARTISESLSVTRPERVRAMELRSGALAAVEQGGSSFRDLDRLVKDLYPLGRNSGELRDDEKKE